MNITRISVLFSVSLFALSLVGCTKSDDHDGAMEKGEHKESMDAGHDMKEHHDVHWSYEGDGAPGKWGSLKSEYATCDSGKSQSPIDISSASGTALAPLMVDYKPTAVNLVNNGHTIQQNYAPGSSITVDGKKFNLLQFHFHSPSEHTIDGKPANLVAHLVHKADDGQLGVIGVLFKKGTENPVVKTLWNDMPMEMKTEKMNDAAMINAADLLPSNLAYYNYSGSLTTPPCSEGVNWMVLTNQVEASEEQVAKFTGVFPLSVRPTQPLHDRMVKMSN